MDPPASLQSARKCQPQEEVGVKPGPEATEVKGVAVIEEAPKVLPEPKEAVKTGVPDIRMGLLLVPVESIGFMENQPGFVLTGTTAPGGTTRAPGPGTTATSWQAPK